MYEAGTVALTFYCSFVRSGVMLGCGENMKRGCAFLEREDLDVCDGWE